MNILLEKVENIELDLLWRQSSRNTYQKKKLSSLSQQNQLYLVP